MTALWTVIFLLWVIVLVDSVAAIALTRQVGLLHLRTAPRSAPQDRGGPQPGSRLRLDIPPGSSGNGSGTDLILFGFVRPECGSCAAALPAFTSVASGLRGNERAVLVSDADEARTRAFLATHGVTLPLVTGPQLLQANHIPGTPYAVAADGAGRVVAAGAAFTTEQLEAVLGLARDPGQVSGPEPHD